MSEKMRGAVFNALGDVEGMTVFDPFAGSGALSFEAISRGAANAIAVDIDKSAVKAIADNTAALGIRNQVKTIRANASGWLETQPGKYFDIVLLDPPYDAVNVDLLEKLAGRASMGGIIVISLPPKSDFQLPSPIYQLLTTNSYGDAQLVFYRRSESFGLAQ